MKVKKVIFLILGIVLIGGGMSAYFYLNMAHNKDYKNSLFVDGGLENGYAKMYPICTSV